MSTDCRICVPTSSYEKDGGVPAISEVKFSLISNRGCFGGCSFCALTFHQGRIMQVRSHESLLDEAKMITQEKDFKGYIHDVGVRRRTSASHPAKNSLHVACVRTASASSRSRVRI